jgi:dihydroorotase
MGGTGKGNPETMAQLLLKNGTLIDPVSGHDGAMDIHITDGVITQLGPNLAAPSAQVVNLRGNVIAPGLIDMHVHLREPGFEYKETIATGVAAAAAGGFTAVCCMPNTEPAIDDESVVHTVQAKGRAALGGLVDVYPIGAVTVGRKGEKLAPLAELAAAGVVAFSDDGAPVFNAELVRRALEYGAMFGRPLIQHAQDLDLTKGGVMHEGFVSTELGLPGMPGIAEEVMVARDMRIAEFTRGRYHVAHVSTAATVDLVREAKRKGLGVSCEATPHHFTLLDEAVRSYDTNTKMNPPLRTADDREALKEGLRDGTIDVIVTDHAPHSFDEKEVEFQSAPFGISGLETSLGLSMTELVRRNVLTLFQLIEKMSTHPRRILGLPAIRIAEGEPANLTVFDPAAEWVVDPSQFKSMGRNTPFAGFRLTGRAVAVLNHGQSLWLTA